jgi:hypothetical protein
VTAELNGLNPHGHVAPYSLSTTSLPPTAVVDGEVVDVLELPPHAVTNKHTAANEMSHLKRRIDTLHSHFDDRQLNAGSGCVWLAPRTSQRADGSLAAAGPELI